MKEALFINKHDNKEGYQTDFDKIAKVLLNRAELKVNKTAYRIIEIEFYYHAANHIDVYCHKNPRQRKSQRLYFHRFNESGKYDALRRKGIDITLGDENEVYGGILIRAVENIRTKKIITGIGKLTNQIIDGVGGANRTDSVRKIYKEDKNIFDSSGMVYLQSSQENSLPIFKKQRQGLNQKKGDEDKFYLDVKYNYFTYPEIEVL
ncbi:hypothetical protein [Ghiorsea bivora]|uniref:hypothetical protein n=1 Tax=Ghiorsea bivora TaxID=1485545 RepID=UPI00057080EE|nr:hypothetical protein [Ghiorsea bivora]